MDTSFPRWSAGDVLKDRYEIVDLFGSAGGTAAYLATDGTNGESLLLWASSTLFKLSTRPPGAREYFRVDGCHCMAIRLEGRGLGLILSAAGRVRTQWAVQWLVEMCTDVGHWHSRRPTPLVCLQGGPLCLSAWRLTEEAHAVIPFYRDVNRPAAIVAPADEYCFSAGAQDPPEPDPRSDVYALGSLFYCLLSGETPADAASLAGDDALQARLREVGPDLPPGLARVILKAMQPDPGRRYATAGEMARDLERFVEKKQPEDDKPPLLERMLPLFLGVIVFGILFLGVNVLIPGKWWGRRSGAEVQPTVVATSTPAPVFTEALLPTPLPRSTETPLPSSSALALLVSQIRLDQFPQIVVYANVLDSNQLPVHGLAADRFHVSQDGIEVPDVQVNSDPASREPLAVILAVDVSSSMNGEPLQQASAALEGFVADLGPEDQVGLVEFDDQIDEVQALTGDREAIRAAIGALASHESTRVLWGDTALYDAIAFSAQQVAGVQSRVAVVVLVDGFDTASQDNTLEDALAVANRAGTPIYMIGLGNLLFRLGLAERLGPDSGGAFFFASSPKDLAVRYREIAALLRSQYRLAFTSRHGADGGVHRLGVRVQIDGGQEVSMEREYIAPR